MGTLTRVPRLGAWILRWGAIGDQITMAWGKDLAYNPHAEASLNIKNPHTRFERTILRYSMYGKPMPSTFFLLVAPTPDSSIRFMPAIDTDNIHDAALFVGRSRMGSYMH